MRRIALVVGACAMLVFAAGVVNKPRGEVAATALPELTEAQRLFLRLASVFQDRRCLNCHTATDYPRQGGDGHRHIMLVRRGPEDKGAIGLPCTTCHQSRNSSTGVPGAPDWHLAPLKMSWEGLTAGEICRSLFDPARGGMTPNALVSHLSTDLVLWAWSPGVDVNGALRRAPPLRQDEFSALAEKWRSMGASCPP
jgi:hypothetical protein